MNKSFNTLFGLYLLLITIISVPDGYPQVHNIGTLMTVQTNVCPAMVSLSAYQVLIFTMVSITGEQKTVSG